MTYAGRRLGACLLVSLLRTLKMQRHLATDRINRSVSARSLILSWVAASSQIHFSGILSYIMSTLESDGRRTSRISGDVNTDESLS